MPLAARDILIDPLTGDLDITDGGRLVSGIQAVAQEIRIRLRTFYGEYFLDNRIGLPWDRWAASKASRTLQREVETLIRDELLSTPGVTGIVSPGVVATFDNRTEVLSVEATCTTSEGDVEVALQAGPSAGEILVTVIGPSGAIL